MLLTVVHYEQQGLQAWAMVFPPRQKIAPSQSLLKFTNTLCLSVSFVYPVHMLYCFWDYEKILLSASNLCSNPS